MAAPSQSRAPDSRNYVEYEEYVDFQLEKTRAIVKRTDILTTVMALAVGVVGYLLAFVVCDQWIIDGGFGYTARVVLLTGVMAVVVGTLVWRVVLPLLKHVHPLYAARVIEKSDPKLQSNLVNFVDVKLANAESAPVVLKSMQKRAAVELSHIDVEEAVDHRPLLRTAYVLLGVVVVAAVYIFWSPKNVFVSVRRALLPTSSVPVATKTMISDVDPGSKDVPARTRQLITAEVDGEEADQAHILFTTADHKYVDEPVRMRRESPGLKKFVGELNGENGKGLLQSLTYRIVAGDARTTDFALNVIQPPSARVDEVQYVFPKYTELGDKTTSGGDIDGWEGTIVTVKATANMKVARAWIVMTDSDEKGGQGEDISMQVADGTALTCSWKLEFRRDGTAPRYYHIRVRTEDQRKDEIDSDPTQYALRIRPDQRPDVALLDPTGDLVRPANAVIPLAVQASDPDFKVRSVILRGTRGGDSLFNQDVKLFEDGLPARTIAGRYDFRLEPLRLKQGEKIQIWIEAKDNKQPTANRTNTTAVNITIDKPVSAEEAEKLLAEDKKVQEEQLQRADPANNPDGKEKEPHEPQVGENRDDQPQPGRERSDPALAQPKDAADQRNDQGDDPGNEAGASDDKNSGRRQRKPADGDEALRRLLKKQPVTEQEQQNSDEDSDPQAAPDRMQQERADGEGEGQSGRDKSKKPGQKNSDQSQTGQDPGREKGSSGEPQQADANSRDEDSASKQEAATDKNSRGNSQQNKATSKSGDKNQTGKKDQAGEEKQSGSKGASRKETGDKPAPDDGDKPDESAGSPKAKSQEKTSREGDPQGPMPGDAGKDEKNKQNPAGKEPGDDADAGTDPTKPDGSPAGKKNDKGKNESGADRPAGDKDDKDGGQSGKDPDEKNPGSKPDGSGEGEKPADDPKNPQQKNQQRGGADSKKADKSEAGGKSKDKTQGGGTPGESDKNDNDADQQEGQGGGDKSPKAGKDPKKPGAGSVPNGPEKPATDDGTAKDKPATGNEEGEATSDEGDGDRERPRASDKVKKKDGTQQGSKKDGSGEDGDKQKSKQKRQPEEGAEGGTDDAEHADRAPDGKKPGEEPGKLEEPPSEKGVERRDRPGERRPGKPPDAGNQEMKGPGREKGQKSENPDTGEQGGGAASDQGDSGANKPGPGDKSDEPGNTDSAKEKTGEKGSKNKGQGSATKPSDEESGKEEGNGGEKPGDKPSGQSEKGAKGGKQGPGQEGGDEQGGQGEGKAGGKPSSKSGGPKGGSESGKSGEAGKESGGESGAKDGSAKGSKPGKPGSGQQRSGSGLSSNPGKGDQPGEGENPDGEPAERSTRTEPPTAEEDAENFENAKKATNLVLKKLKSQLERGDVDQELLDEMGWKDNKDVAKFVKYLESNLKDADDDSPEAQARRLQFEVTLRNLEVGSDTQRRSGSVGKERAIQQIGTKNVPPPREYQKIWESYTRSLSNQGDKADAKAKASEKAPKSKPAPDKSGKIAPGKK